MKAGICLVGYTYRGYEMEYAFQRAREYGFDSIELRNFRDINFETIHSLRESVQKARRLSSKHGVEVPVIFVPIRLGYDEKGVLQFLPFLAESNISILHTHVHLPRPDSWSLVSAEAREEDYRKAANTLRMIGEVAKDHNITIAVESHMGTIHDTSSSLIRLLEYADSEAVRASLDFANLLIVNRNEDLAETIERLAGKVAYTHIKNCRFYPWGYDWGVPLQFGDINYHEVLKELIESGYSGLFATEYCGDGDPDIFACIDGAYLRRLLDRLTMESKQE